MATLLKTNGAAVDWEDFPQHEGLQLPHMKEAIGGGRIEIVTLMRGAGWVLALIVDDEGLLKELLSNPVATALYQRMTGSPNPIAGDALLVTGYDIGLNSERWV